LFTFSNACEPQCGGGKGKTRAACKVAPAQHALALLARLFRYGEISYHGGFINLASGVTSVLRADATITTRLQSVINHYQSGRGQKSGFRGPHPYQWL
jgi:hypothetical protein